MPFPFAREDYFRINPMFETGSKKYEWMSRILAVGIFEVL